MAVRLNRLMLTDRQEEILHFISDYQDAHTVPPSTRVVQKHFGFGSQTSVIRHLKALAAKKAVEQLADGSWGVKAKEVQTRLFELPVYGSIPAGIPAMQEQQPVRTIGMDLEWFGLRRPRKHHLWGLEVTGDSMIGAHICPGDIGVFERREPRVGDILAAWVDGGATLKRLAKVQNKLVLRAENPKYPDIIPAEHLEAQGVLIGVIRRGIA